MQERRGRFKAASFYFRSIEMEMSWRAVVVGALAGLLSAAVVDVNAWARAEGDFDWSLAVRRWVAGAVTGASAALGISATGV
ncbi:MAG: hypothetical protein KF784_02280 [Fimbriimonadaceae bacterium]|nr:hypothetical protein [Fimbriimonadaceae bacterium]